MNADRPVPIPDPESAPFWAAAARGQLTLPRCSVCSRFTLPPEQVCPRCGSADPVWVYETVSGHGTICAWTVVRQAFLPGVDIPFVLVDVEVAEQPDLRLVGRLVDGPDAPIRSGSAVRAVFETVSDDIGIPAFRLTSDRPTGDQLGVDQ